ncbi:unnamed protein product [Brassicogethes aeneus]|uniref:Tetraspanin n=1 Tax=Brassicogethes aeneus TaxID=1431903 RepID=A0A9P0B696_BRAAE|nr:unnamed protein product [Brassicogethes aeneus]
MKSCSLSFIKLLLFVFNIVFCIIGIAFIGVGAYILTSLKDVKTFLDTGIIHSSGILIATGVIIFVISFFGCCGAKRESRCMLNTFIAFLVAVIILEIAVGVMAALYKQNFKDAFKDAMTKSIQDKNNPDKDAWDGIQKGIAGVLFAICMCKGIKRERF